jgi:hypothetical protein
MPPDGGFNSGGRGDDDGLSGGEQGQSSSSGSGGVLWWVWLIAALGGLCCCCVIFALATLVRRKKKRHFHIRESKEGSSRTTIADVRIGMFEMLRAASRASPRGSRGSPASARTGVNTFLQARAGISGTSHKISTTSHKNRIVVAPGWSPPGVSSGHATQTSAIEHSPREKPGNLSESSVGRRARCGQQVREHTSLQASLASLATASARLRGGPSRRATDYLQDDSIKELEYPGSRHRGTKEDSRSRGRQTSLEGRGTTLVQHGSSSVLMTTMQI